MAISCGSLEQLNKQIQMRSGTLVSNRQAHLKDDGPPNMSEMVSLLYKLQNHLELYFSEKKKETKIQSINDCITR